ncbi:MAG: spore germination protein [Sporolactobacillus sp.]|jgi:spore germination protein KA|nr:spore germination protein [Sporolactobacillus sp.]
MIPSIGKFILTERVNAAEKGIKTSSLLFFCLKIGDPSFFMNQGRLNRNGSIIKNIPRIILTERMADRSWGENMFRNFLKHLRSRKAKPGAVAAKPSDAMKRAPLSKSLSANIATLKTAFGNSEDLVFREFYFGADRQFKAAICFIDGIIDKKVILDNIIRSLMVDVHIIDDGGHMLDGGNSFRKIKQRLLNTASVREIHSVAETIDDIVGGNVCLLINGSRAGLSIEATGGEKRNIEKSANEIVIRGPQEAFVETLRTNTSMLRRIIRNPDLIFESFTIGQRTRSKVCIAYIKGIADDKIVREVRTRLERIDIDATLGAGYIEQMIEDKHTSPFATVGNSERPDKVAAKMLEGRVAILIDGTPVVLTVPYMMIEAFQVPDDYYSRPFNVNVMRLIRFLGFAITLTLPALYVSIITFHQEMVPTVLLIKLTAAREGIPFPLLFEALISEIIFLLIRESGVRMPRATGSAVTIVGSLVMGDAAVTAGLISAPMVIVTSLSGITSFIIPALYNAVVIFKFLLILMGGCFGLFGVVVGLLCMLAHMCALRSFGTPFMAPFAPIFPTELLKDTFFRMPLQWMKQRPQSVTWNRTDRQGKGRKSDPHRR